MPDTLLTELNDGVLTITLNNPTKHNCMGFEMLYALRITFSQAARDNNVKVILITGAGERSFSTGANIKEFNAFEDKEVERWIIDGNRIFNQLEKLSKPTVALINGYAMGGGLELALCCDFRIAMANALLASPELKNGWLPGWGGMTRLRKLVGISATKQIVLLSGNLNAEQSLKLGLVTQVLTAEQKQEFLDEFLDKLKNIRPEVFALAKAAIMDEYRTTEGSDLYFDVMAVDVARKEPKS